MSGSDQPDPESDALNVLDDATNSWRSTSPTFPDAGGWLVSTVDDYWSFVSMLLAGGTVWRSNRQGTGILLTQRATSSPAPTAIIEDFWAGVNGLSAIQQ